MSHIDTNHKNPESHNLEEIIALGMYRHRKEKIMKIFDKIIMMYGGKNRSIEEIRKSLSKIDESMSDYIISERE
ncbi:MAG: hypothetical protein R6U61_02365 [Thermoplasmata archaeon]